MNEENNELNNVNAPVEPVTEVPAEPIQEVPVEPVQEVPVETVPVQEALVDSPVEPTVQEAPVEEVPVSTIPETPTFEGPLTNTTLEEKPVKKSPVLLIVIILLIVSLGVGGYFAYAKFFKKDNDVKPVDNPVVEPAEETPAETPVENPTEEPAETPAEEPSSETAMSDDEALQLGKTYYKKLQAYMDQFQKDAENATNEMCINFEGKKECNTDEMFVKHNNFLEEFQALFASNVQVNDVFSQYSGNFPNFEEEDFTCNFGDCYSSNHFAYHIDNNEYYIDSACRASGCEALKLNAFKLVTNESNKLTFSYRLLRTKSIGEAMCDFESESEYNDYVKNAKYYTLELVKENEEWKISKGAYNSKCNNAQGINQ